MTVPGHHARSFALTEAAETLSQRSSGPAFGHRDGASPSTGDLGGPGGPARGRRQPQVQDQLEKTADAASRLNGEAYQLQLRPE